MITDTRAKPVYGNYSSEFHDPLPLQGVRVEGVGDRRPLIQPGGYVPITPFYKRGCQEKYFPYDWKRSRHPAPVCNEAL